MSVEYQSNLIDFFITTLCLGEDYTIEHLEAMQSALSTVLEENKKYDSIDAFFDKLFDLDYFTEDPLDANVLEAYKSKYRNYTKETLSRAFSSEANKTKTIEQPDNPDIQLDAQLDTFTELLPSEKSTSYYWITFYKTFFKWCLQNKNYTHNLRLYIKVLNIERQCEVHLEPLMLTFFALEHTNNFSKNIRKSLQRMFGRIIQEQEYSNRKLEYTRLYAQIVCFLLFCDVENDNSNTQSTLKLQINLKTGNVKITPQSVNAYLNYLIANGFIDTKHYSSQTALEYAKKGLNISDLQCRADAYNTLGYLAIATEGQLQLAYDAYSSWIRSRIVGEIEKQNLCTVTDPFSKQEKAWRRKKNNKLQAAIMHSNLAYASSSIGDTYEVGSKRRRDFYEIAEKEIKAAIDICEKQTRKAINKEASDYYCSCGTILSTQVANGVQPIKNFKDALSYYEKYHKSADFFNITRSVKKAEAINHCCIMIMNLLTHSCLNLFKQTDDKAIQDNAFFTWHEKESSMIQKLIQQLITYEEEYDDLSSGFIYGKEKDDVIAAHNKIKKVLDLLMKHQKDELLVNCVMILIFIRQTIEQIRFLLRRLEYSNKPFYTRDSKRDASIPSTKHNGIIAYYTKLETAKFLFDELYQEPNDIIPREAKENETGKNCLTITHAKYMNDPYEGIPLLEALRPKNRYDKLLPKESIVTFRDDIYKDTFVFLKSFTDQLDSLGMWNRYGSDKNTEGKDCNGCCIQFDPEMFNQIINSKNAAKASSSVDNEGAKDKTLISGIDDDYYLYRMVYLTKSGEIAESKNQSLPAGVRTYYAFLRYLVNELSKQINKSRNHFSSQKEYDGFTADVKDILRDSLQTIIFLFKSADYIEENESRLIIIREAGQEDTISLLPTNPPKLAIKPYEQVYINRVRFGPNVQEPELWEPFFQYGLNKMWQKYAKVTGDTSKPVYERYTIDKSEIHYHT